MNAQGSSSDWETDTEYDAEVGNPSSSKGAPRAHAKKQKSITLVLSPTKASEKMSLSRQNSQRRNTMPASGSSGQLHQPRLIQTRLGRDISFISTSSTYSDASHAMFDHVEIPRIRPLQTTPYRVLHQPVAPRPARNSDSNLSLSHSKASTMATDSSEPSTGRSMFLSPSAERDVSRALQSLGTRMPLQRGMSFSGVSARNPHSMQGQPIRSFYNADAVDSA